MSYCPTCFNSFDKNDQYCPFDGMKLNRGNPPGSPDDSPVANNHSAATEIISSTNQNDRGDDKKPASKPTESIGETSHRSKTAHAYTPSDGVPATKSKALSAKENLEQVLENLKNQDPSAEYNKLIGQVLDHRYKIEKKIGEGGMGVVFLAKHTIIEKPVAIKVLKREVANDDSVVKRFVREAKAASRIGHPNIADVTDFGTTPDGMTYSVMEFVDGTTLSKVIKDAAPLIIARSLVVTAQIANALGAAHKKGIVHRDLKPENIFLVTNENRSDFVKIVDFGIAKILPTADGQEGPRLTRAGSVFGTPEYMAPEQAAGKTDTDQRVDIYALGTILYEMVVGVVPHKGENTMRTLAMQLMDPIIPPRQKNPNTQISDEFEAVVMKSLAKDPDDRYQTMAEFLDALQQVSGGIPLTETYSITTKQLVIPSTQQTHVLRPEKQALPSVKEPPPAQIAMQRESGIDGVVTASPTRGSEPAFISNIGKSRDDSTQKVKSTNYDVQTPPRTRPIFLVFLLIASTAFGAYHFVNKNSAKAPILHQTIDAGGAIVADAAIEKTIHDATTPPPPRMDAGKVRRPKIRATVKTNHPLGILFRVRPGPTKQLGSPYAKILRSKGSAEQTIVCRMPKNIPQTCSPGTATVKFDRNRTFWCCICCPDIHMEPATRMHCPCR